LIDEQKLAFSTAWAWFVSAPQFARTALVCWHFDHVVNLRFGTDRNRA